MPEQLIQFFSGIYFLVIKGNPFTDEDDLLESININRIHPI